MAAGDNISLTNTKITALNTDQALTFNAADQDTINLTQKFIYTPTGYDNKICIGFQVGDTHGAVAYSIAVSPGVFGSVAVTGSVAQAATEIVQIETGRFISATGTIEITATPATGKRLTSDHALKIFVIELI